MLKNKKILVCPLNWGLGHATRDVPIIRELIQNGFEVFIAASGNTFDYLKSEFPKLKIIDFPGYTIRYSKSKTQLLKMSLLLPAIIYWTFKEHLKLKEIIQRYQIEIIISDNRFGLWNRNVYSVFITHQLKVKFPGWFQKMEFVYTNLLNVIINKYDECWIPDYHGNINLSGELSHVNNRNTKIHYIGPLSRLSLVEKSAVNKKDIDILFILSGPEPQRSIFESIIFNQTQNNLRNYTIVRGTNKKTIHRFAFPSFQILNSDELFELIKRSNMIVCRSGYSSVMDLVHLGKQAVLIPTPGQTEQEYLADYLKAKVLFYSINQNDFDINKAIDNCFDSPKISVENEKNVLMERILNLKDK